MATFNRSHSEPSPQSELVKHDLFDVFNVSPHRRLCRVSIVALDRSQDPAVSGERLLRASFYLQRAFPRVAQQVHDNVENFKHDTVTRSQSNAVMKFSILSDSSVSLTLLFRLPLQNLFHLGNFISGSMRGGTCCERGFKHLSKIQQLRYHLPPALQRILKRISHQLGGR